MTALTSNLLIRPFNQNHCKHTCTDRHLIIYHKEFFKIVMLLKAYCEFESAANTKSFLTYQLGQLCLDFYQCHQLWILTLRISNTIKIPFFSVITLSNYWDNQNKNKKNWDNQNNDNWENNNKQSADVHGKQKSSNFCFKWKWKSSEAEKTGKFFKTETTECTVRLVNSWSRHVG